MTTLLPQSSGTAALIPQHFLGKVVEICIVTPNLREMLEGLVRLGMGPFKIYKFTPETVMQQTYASEPTNFSIEVAFAEQEGMVWEVMQPISGPTIMQGFLDGTNGKGGIQHVAFGLRESEGKADREPLVGEKAHQEALRRRAEFEKRGFTLTQSGIWHGKTGTCEFMYFDTKGAVTTCFESYVFSDHWEDPEDTEYFPSSALA